MPAALRGVYVMVWMFWFIGAIIAIVLIAGVWNE